MARTKQTKRKKSRKDDSIAKWLRRSSIEHRAVEPIINETDSQLRENIRESYEQETAMDVKF